MSASITTPHGHTRRDCFYNDERCLTNESGIESDNLIDERLADDDNRFTSKTWTSTNSTSETSAK